MSPQRAPRNPGSTHSERVTRSATWAAWADALGFISELTDERGLQRRLGKHGPQLAVPVEWRRRVGGRYGVEMELPAGCYSDDTQLRLAVGRAVTGAGFDVEAFARVELPVWPSYALGGGRSSKAAAANLAKANTAWYANFYEGWTDGGGNGVAMRIQPHVWSASEPAGHGQHMRDVLLDAVTTHGHPRALFGAVLHAVALGETLATGKVPSADRWSDLLATATGALALIDGHPEIDGLWRPSWESQVGRPLADAWADVATECEKMLALAADTLGVASSDHRRGPMLKRWPRATETWLTGSGSITTTFVAAPHTRSSRRSHCRRRLAPMCGRLPSPPRAPSAPTPTPSPPCRPQYPAQLTVPKMHPRSSTAPTSPPKRNGLPASPLASQHNGLPIPTFCTGCRHAPNLMHADSQMIAPRFPGSAGANQSPHKTQ
jgi:ADP-ribosylglycohydrolase